MRQWRFRRPSHGMGHDISPPRDCNSTARRRQRAGVSLRGDLCYDSWSLGHLGYLYPGTTPVMIKLDIWSLSHLGYLYPGTTPVMII